MATNVTFPFSAVVSLEKLKLAILINAINPKIGGVLIQGPKGSGKTTIVRGLTEILPKIDVVKDCKFNCNPFDVTNLCEKCKNQYERKEEFSKEKKEMKVVNLPLGATEDRVVGSLDVEKIIKDGIGSLEPGILAEANQNILYVDEINLLPDHIADDLLDAAATGWNVVEREGISVSHPARFIFIGTMNPEEGTLRPQLLDRFPLSIHIDKVGSVEERMAIVRRNLEFEADPTQFIREYEPSRSELTKRIKNAREILPTVELEEKLLEAICRSCLKLEVDGVRPDIVISKAARTLAAFENRTLVSPEDVYVASELVLSHRTRQGGFLEPATQEEITETMTASVKQVKYVPKAKKPDTSSRENKKPKGKSFIQAMTKTTEEQEEKVKKKSLETRSSRL